MLNGRLKTWLSVLGDRVRIAHGRVLCKPEMEPVYQTLLRRDLQALGIADDFYPVGGAANHSLLYLILRCFADLELGNVLELGCGQSSILIDRLNRRLPRDRTVCSLEHDPFWGAAIQRKVGHPVLRDDLRCERFRRAKTYHYNWGLLPADARFELLVIDGPPAADRGLEYARLGALKLLPRLSAAGFVVIVDDAERTGERLLASEIVARLSQQRRDIKVSETLAAKRQIVIAAGTHQAAAYF